MARHILMRTLVLAATTVAVMGYSLTHSYAFVLLPFVAGVALALLAVHFRMVAPDDITRQRASRVAIVQVTVSCLIVIGSVIYELSTRPLGAVPYGIMLATLVVLLVLTIIDYRRHLPGDEHCPAPRFGRRARLPSDCDDLKSASRVYGDEEKGRVGRQRAKPHASDDRGA